MSVRFLIIVGMGVLLSLLSGCKPTEKNYQEAYDAAKKKQERVAAESATSLPVGRVLQSIDGTVHRTVNGNDIDVTADFLKYISGTQDAMNIWNVAVALYKMPTNCKAQTQDLCEKGYKAFAAEGLGSKYYVIAASFPNIEEAAKFAKEYSNKVSPDAFVGLSGNPLLIEKR